MRFILLLFSLALTGCGVFDWKDKWCDTGSTWNECCETEILYKTCEDQACFEGYSASELVVRSDCYEHFGVDSGAEFLEEGCDTGFDWDCEDGGSGPSSTGTCPEGLYGTWSASYAPSFYEGATDATSDCHADSFGLEFFLECDCNADDGDTLCYFSSTGDIYNDNTGSSDPSREYLSGGNNELGARCDFSGASISCDLYDGTTKVADLDGTWSGATLFTVGVGGDPFDGSDCQGASWGDWSFSRTSTSCSTCSSGIWGSECGCSEPAPPPAWESSDDYLIDALIVEWRSWQFALPPLSTAERHAAFDDLLDDYELELELSSVERDIYDVIGHKAIQAEYDDPFFSTDMDSTLDKYENETWTTDQTLNHIIVTVNRFFADWPDYTHP